ncbi:MAG: hypothetical protein AB7P24_18930 [Nitrospira sp.]
MIHRSTAYFFEIRYGDQGEFAVNFSPGEERITEFVGDLSWINVQGSFTGWLRILKREIQQPDLWASISGDTHLMRLASDQDNQPFRSDEQLQVKKALGEIKSYLIHTHGVSGARLEAMEKQLSYLEEAATRLGRKDWTGILVSNLISIALTLSLSADGARDLFRFAGQIVKQLLGTILYLAGPH